MKQKQAIFAWMIMAISIGLAFGSCIYAFFAYTLASPALRPSTWPGWNIIFFTLVIGTPILFATVALWQRSKGRLPGTQDGKNHSRLE